MVQYSTVQYSTVQYSMRGKTADQFNTIFIRRNTKRMLMFFLNAHETVRWKKFLTKDKLLCVFLISCFESHDYGRDPMTSSIQPHGMNIDQIWFNTSFGQNDFSLANVPKDR